MQTFISNFITTFWTPIFVAVFVAILVYALWPGKRRAFDEAGGHGSKVLIRRVWLGRLHSGLVARQRAVYETYGAHGRTFGDDQTIAADEPREMAERLAATMDEVGADALNLRVQLPGIAPEEVRDQITHIGSTVVGLLRARRSRPTPHQGD